MTIAVDWDIKSQEPNKKPYFYTHTFIFQQYNFTVTVFDQINYGSADVTINILDVNDNPPKVNDYTFTSFTENDYSIVGVIETVSILTLCILIDSSFWFDTINLGWSNLYI